MVGNGEKKKEERDSKMVVKGSLCLSWEDEMKESGIARGYERNGGCVEKGVE